VRFTAVRSPSCWPSGYESADLPFAPSLLSALPLLRSLP
jgi:hypothetical protein